MTDAERLETYADAEVLTRECERYGLPVPPLLPTLNEQGQHLRILLRHVYNNRDCAHAINMDTIDRQHERLMNVRSAAENSDWWDGDHQVVGAKLVIELVEGALPAVTDTDLLRDRLGPHAAHLTDEQLEAVLRRAPEPRVTLATNKIIHGTYHPVHQETS